jgi:excisionase family DNA binding protein
MRTLDDILSVEAAAGLLDLSASAVYKLLQQGELPGAKIGGQWRVRGSDLDRAFDLARAKAMAQQREKEAATTWASALDKLHQENPDGEYVLTRCAWCPEWIPTWSGMRYVTLCSGDCASELRRAFGALGWHLRDYTLSPIYQVSMGDATTLALDSQNLIAEVMYGIAPDWELVNTWNAARHGRGPLRELLLLEHPYLRGYNQSSRVAGPAGSHGGDARAGSAESADDQPTPERHQVPATAGAEPDERGGDPVPDDDEPE